MTLRVPYIADEAIERDAETLLAQYACAKGAEIRAPIPIEDIVEKHLKLRFEFDDLTGCSMSHAPGLDRTLISSEQSG